MGRYKKMKKYIIIVLILLPLMSEANELQRLASSCEAGNKQDCIQRDAFMESLSRLVNGEERNVKFPETYSSLGKELALFKEDCIIYRNVNLLPKKIRQSCQQYIKDVKVAFKLGYGLDKSIDSENINKKQLDRYYVLLKNADKKREKLIEKIREEKYKARKNNDIKYYSQLLKGDQIKVGDEDYAFMKQHLDEFQNNLKYIAYEFKLQEKRREEQKRKKAEEQKRKKVEEQKRKRAEEREQKRLEKIKKKKEHNKKLLAAAKQDLERQISESKTSKHVDEINELLRKQVDDYGCEDLKGADFCKPGVEDSRSDHW